MTALYEQMADFARTSIDRGVYDIEPAGFDTNPDPLLPALEDADCGLIAEIRIAEARMGRIPKDLDAKRNVREMLRRGASAVAVMTEQMKFGGNLDLIGQARQGAPVVMRDFVVGVEQIQAAAHAGASAVTLDAIFDEMGHAELPELVDAALDRDLEPIVLVRDEEQLDRADEAEAPIVGVLQRDPVTRETLDAADLVPEVPVPAILVGGIRTADDRSRARELGAVGAWIDGPLVGHDTPWEVVEQIAEG